MPTDLTGTPTSLGIGTYNVDVDAPSGLGFNAAMAQIDALIAGRLATPSGIATGEVPVWNGSTWVRSSTLGMAPSGISGYPSDATKTLHGDGSWKTDEIGYDQITANVTITGTTDAASTTVIAGSAYTFDGNPVIAEFYSPNVVFPAVNNQAFIVSLFEGATQIARIWDARNPGTAGGVPVLARYRFTPAAGSHTYSIKALVSSTTGTPIVSAGASGAGNDSPAYLRFTRASS